MSKFRMIVVTDPKGKTGKCFSEADYVGLSDDPWHSARSDAKEFLFDTYGRSDDLRKPRQCAYLTSTIKDVIFYKPV